MDGKEKTEERITGSVRKKMKGSSMQSRAESEAKSSLCLTAVNVTPKRLHSLIIRSLAAKCTHETRH